MIKIGQKIEFWPSLYYGKKRVTGELIYVHPKKRFVRVRFTSTDYFGRTVELTECLKIINGKIDTGRGKPHAMQT